MKGIIFDCDGVIVDSEVIYLESLKRFLSNQDIQVEIKDIQYVVGMKMPEICKALKNQFDLEQFTNEELAEKQNVYFDEYWENCHITPMKGIKEFLDRCKSKNLIISLASSSGKDYIHDLLERFDLKNYFDYIVTGEVVQKGKPDPDIFLYTLDKMKLNKDDVIIVEDSVNGIRAGVASGIYTVGFKGSKIEQDTSEADVQVYSFDEILI